MKIDTNPEKIKEVLERGVENIYPSREALEEVLKSGKKLRIYNGIDPTGKLHIGHAAVLNKLRQLQDLGHEIIILIGDFTATIGDPTGKPETRKVLTRKQVLENAKNYKKQIGKILDSKTKFLQNEKWTNKLKPSDLLSLVGNFTVARLLERDMFQERIKAGGDITVQEFLYPILQAYDSVAMDVDMEIGGNDQTFNMLAGRTLMRKMKDKEKFVLTTKLLVDSTGKKMGKTEGNMVNLDELPQEMYGKIMSWPDNLIGLGFEICTRVPFSELAEIKNELNSGVNPRDLKARLAKEIVTIYSGQKEAEKAAKNFDSIFREKELPSDMPEADANDNRIQSAKTITDLIFNLKMAESKSEAKRLIEQGGVDIGGVAVKDWSAKPEVKSGDVIKVGKRKFIRIK